MISAARAEAIRILYVQARTSMIAAIVVTVYMVATAWPYDDKHVILGWLGIQIVAQVARAWLLLRFSARHQPDERLERWAMRYTVYMAFAGLIWGATAFLFMHPHEPITIALTLCGLYGISGGSVSGNAYNPSGQIAFVVGIFALVALRLLLADGPSLTALAIASTVYAGILWLFTNVQARTILDAITIRFENRELLIDLRDKTQEAEDARMRAEQANLAKSQFLAAASHDLRQPLYALGLFSGSLESLVLDAKAREVVRNIQRNIDAMESLFDGLLDLSRFDAGAVTVTRRAVSIDMLFQRIEQLFGAIAAEKGIELRLRSNNEWVCSDPVLLEQILSNLVSNAVRHTQRGGVLIAARTRGDRVDIELWDTGQGIAEADQTRIFGDFVQLDNPERDRRKGLGLGLAIAQRAAASLETSIRLRSQIGRGSVFRVSQPLTAEQSAAASVVAMPNTDIVFGLRVLAVEDEPDVQTALASLFDQWGIVSQVVGSSAEAIALLEQGPRYDVLLTDQRLTNGETGLALIAEVRARLPAAPAIALITGDLDSGIIAAAKALKVPIVHKPVQPGRLRAMLNHLGTRTYVAPSD